MRGKKEKLKQELLDAPRCLTLLADWFDDYDREHGNTDNTVQTDLRRWANAISSLLEK